MGYKINPEDCTVCGTCEAVCPNMAIEIMANGKYQIDQDECESCGNCYHSCSFGAVVEE